ncbi:MAG: YCF48-related protein [Bacteroidetes bacterium]|nr:YCF48-related protein [Bacteroidota bacterium]
MNRLNHILLIVLLPLFLHSQHPWYRISTLPQENTLCGLKKIPGANKIIAVGSGSTVMISSDFGDNWELILNPGGLDNEAELREVEFINPYIGYIVGLKGIILKTIDGGYHWELVRYTGGQWDEFTDVSLSVTNNAFAVGEDDLIIRTFDGGVTWDTLYTQAGFTFTDIDFLNSDTGYIFGGSGEKYIKTINGGLNWVIRSLSLQFSNTTIYKACFPNPQLGFISCVTSTSYEEKCRFFRTSDGGESWGEVYTFWSLYPFGMDYMNDTIIMVSGCSVDYSNSVFTSHDRGNTWLQTYLPGFMPWGGFAIVCDTIDRALVVGRLGDIDRTTDNGLTWQAIDDRFFCGDITDVHFINDEKGFLTAEIWGGGTPACGLYKTIDGGDTWTGCFSPDLFSIAVVHFCDDNNGWIATDCVWDLWLYRTTDGGVSWSVLETTINNEDNIPNCIKFQDEDFGYLATDEHIYQTTDGGYNWVIRKNGYFTDIELKHWPVCFAAGWSGLHRSGDAGTNWQYIDIPNGILLNDIFFLNYYTGFLCGNSNRIFRTRDGGISWEQLTVTTPHPIDFYEVCFTNLTTGFAVGDGSYETMVYTQDGGDTWEVMPSISTSALHHIRFNDLNTGLIFGEKGLILKTESGGITGNEDKSLSQELQLTIFPNPSGDILKIAVPDGIKQDIFLKIYDLSGSIVLSKNYSRTLDILTMDISQLSKGIYIVTLFNEDQSWSTKILKF